MRKKIKYAKKFDESLVSVEKLGIRVMDVGFEKLTNDLRPIYIWNNFVQP